MKKLTIRSLSTALMLSMAAPAFAGAGHDHGSGGHHHGADVKQKKSGDHGHYFDGKAGDFTSVKDALVALKAVLAEADQAVANNDLKAMDALFPRIEAAGAYLHDNAKAASSDVADRFHASVDQMMGIFGQMHDVAHGTDQAAAKRLLKKANGSVMLVENFLPASDRVQ